MVAAARVPLRRSLCVLPAGFVMGLLVMSLAFFRISWFPAIEFSLFGLQAPLHLVVAALILIGIGAMSGFFVVPMNAILQHRGHVLMSAGHSIAVQNFNENLSVLSMLCFYALLVRYHLDVRVVIMLFSMFVCGVMLIIMKRHRENERSVNLEALIAETP
jgi:hypothetical protein